MVGRSWWARISMIVLMGGVLCWTVPVYSQHGEAEHDSPHQVASAGHASHVVSAGTMAWEGSVEGIAFSEFNHHLAGVLVILMGLAELAQASRLPPLGWVKVLLPVSFSSSGAITKPGLLGRSVSVRPISVVIMKFFSIRHSGSSYWRWASWNFYAGSGDLASSCGPSHCRSSRPSQERCYLAIRMGPIHPLRRLPFTIQ